MSFLILAPTAVAQSANEASFRQFGTQGAYDSFHDPSARTDDEAARALPILHNNSLVSCEWDKAGQQIEAVEFARIPAYARGDGRLAFLAPVIMQCAQECGGGVSPTTNLSFQQSVDVQRRLEACALKYPGHFSRQFIDRENRLVETIIARNAAMHGQSHQAAQASTQGTDTAASPAGGAAACADAKHWLPNTTRLKNVPYPALRKAMITDGWVGVPQRIDEYATYRDIVKLFDAKSYFEIKSCFADQSSCLMEFRSRAGATLEVKAWYPDGEDHLTVDNFTVSSGDFTLVNCR